MLIYVILLRWIKMKCKLRKEFKDNVKMIFIGIRLFILAVVFVLGTLLTLPFILGFLVVWVFGYTPEYFATSPYTYYSLVGVDICIFIFFIGMFSWVVDDIYTWLKKRPKREVIRVKVGIFKRIKDKIFECEEK